MTEITDIELRARRSFDAPHLVRRSTEVTGRFITGLKLKTEPLGTKPPPLVKIHTIREATKLQKALVLLPRIDLYLVPRSGLMEGKGLTEGKDLESVKEQSRGTTRSIDKAKPTPCASGCPRSLATH